MTEPYQASCHCGAIRYRFECEPITSALRCTCSICSRKGAMMTPFVVPLEDIHIEANPDDIGLYEFDTRVAKHYFCKHCGIYTHNETARFPGQCRINLGCIEGLDTSDFEVAIFDGKNLL